MRLISGDFVEANFDRRIFTYTMWDGEDRINCSASYEFVDDLDPKRKLHWKERPEQFALLRAEIERRTDRKFVNDRKFNERYIDLRTNDAK